MKRILLTLTAMGAFGGVASAQAALTLYSNGDTNVKELWEKYLIPMYQAKNPGVKINLVYAAHGSSDEATIDRMVAARKAGKTSGIDLLEGPVDVAGAARLLEKVSKANVPLVTRVAPNVLARAKAFGVPYRGSSVVLAYNSDVVKNPPRTLNALLDWIKKNPGQFTYNAPDTGGSGNAFVQRIMKMGIPANETTFFETQYDPKKVGYFDKGIQTLKELAPSLYQNGQYSQNNVGTLQLLAKGAINMGPVWSDMALKYLKEGLLPPNIKLAQIKPAFSGGSAYIGVVKDSPNKAAALKFVNWLLSSEAQVVVVNQMNGYPGVQLKYLPANERNRFGNLDDSYSFGLSGEYGSDMTRLWYERVAGQPQPKK